MTAAPEFVSLDRAAPGGDWLIDRDRWYPYDAMGCGERPEELTFLFAQLRAVRVRALSNGLEVVWDADRAHRISIFSLRRFLRSTPADLTVCLRFYKSGWASEIHTGPREASHRIAEIESYRGSHLLEQTAIRPQSLGALADGPPLLRAAWETWRAHRDPLALATSSVGEAGFRLQASEGRLLFDQIGRDAEISRLLGEPWRETAVGSTIESAMGTDDFNTRTVATMRRALESGEPIYDHVLAHIDFGSRKEWKPYPRLLLPDEFGPGGGLYIYAVVTPDIDISFLNRAA